MPAPRRLIEYAAIIALIALAIWFAVKNWLPEQMM
jgi:Flp pilus assembly pilin Flp